jgi:hypothetical protein
MRVVDLGDGTFEQCAPGAIDARDAAAIASDVGAPL